MTSGLTGYVRYSKLEEYVTLKSFLELKNYVVRHEELETVIKNVEQLTILMNDLKYSIENNVAQNKNSLQNNEQTIIENEIKLLKEEKEENIKKIEIIKCRIAKLNFEQKELKESIDENWEITDKNRDKNEKADEQIKSLVEECATVKASVSENLNSNHSINDKLKVLDAKIATVIKKEDQSHALPTRDGCHVKCENCDVVLADKAQLKQHIKTKHRRRIICRICEQSFEESFNLEEHLISEHKKSKGFKCTKCECSFVLKWRLKKHSEGHRSGIKVKTCHYFNNNKVCPYEFVGCMFQHAEAKECPSSNSCSKTKCQFRHC